MTTLVLIGVIAIVAIVGGGAIVMRPEHWGKRRDA